MQVDKHMIKFMYQGQQGLTLATNIFQDQHTTLYNQKLEMKHPNIQSEPDSRTLMVNLTFLINIAGILDPI